MKVIIAIIFSLTVIIMGYSAFRYLNSIIQDIKEEGRMKTAALNEIRDRLFGNSDTKKA